MRYFVVTRLGVWRWYKCQGTHHTKIGHQLTFKIQSLQVLTDSQMNLKLYSMCTHGIWVFTDCGNATCDG